LNIEKRILVTLSGNKLTRGRFEYVVVNIDQKVGTTPASLDVAVLDTDGHTYTIVISGNDDGNYTIEANGTAATFAASSNSIEEIRDGLLASMTTQWAAICAVAAVSTNTISVTALSTPVAYVLEETADPATNIAWTEPVGAFGGSNTIFSSTGNTITGTAPELVVSEGPDEPRPFNTKGTDSTLQIVISLTGADGTTDYDVSLQSFVQLAYEH
jgi:hypothetical protein